MSVSPATFSWDNPLQSLHSQIAITSREQLPASAFDIISHEWITTIAVAIITTVGLYLCMVTTITFEAVFISGMVLAGIALFLHTLATSDANYMDSSGINPAHYRRSLELEQELLTLPDGVDEESIDLGDLITLFDQINFEHPERADYIDPSRIENDGYQMNSDGARSHIVELVGHIQRRSHFCGVPSDDAGRNRYYDHVERLTRIVVHEMNQGYVPINVQNNILLRLAAAGGHCAGRYMGEILESYQRATRSAVTTVGIESDILEKLHSVRRGLINEIVLDYHPWVSDIFQVHVVNTYTKHLGPIRGIRGSEAADYDDPYAHSVGFATAKLRFDSKYTKSYILERVSWWINGQPSDEDPTNRVGREYGDNTLPVGWFKAHIPSGWQPADPITDQDILQQMASFRSTRVHEINDELNALRERLTDGEVGLDDQIAELENRRTEIQNVVTEEMARQSCIEQVFLGEFVYNEDMTLIKDEAIEYMLRSMEVLS